MVNWSLVLNVLLLIGVVFALFQMVRSKQREKARQQMYRAEPIQAEPQQDDIIAVRKLRPRDDLDSSIHERQADTISPLSAKEPTFVAPSISAAAVQKAPQESLEPKEEKPHSLMMFLLAKDDRQLAGYELLQTILAAGLRFGDGQLFHRHQHISGQGPIVCSLATATESGVFDLQNIGAFSVRGLCLFMETSGNASIDAERLDIMLETAKQLSEGLETHLLDDRQKPWSDRSLARYHQLIGMMSEEVAYLD